MAVVITVCLFSILSMSLTFFIAEKRLSEHSKEVNRTLAENAASGSRKALISEAHRFLRIIASEQSSNCNNLLNTVKFNVKLLEGVVQDIFNNPHLYLNSRPVIRPSETVAGTYANTYSLHKDIPMTEEIKRELDLLSNLNLLVPVLAENPDIVDLFVGTTSGLFYNYTTLAFENPEYDPRLRPWYIQALEHPDDVIFTEVYEDAFGAGKVITAAKAVFDNQGKLIGVAALDILLDNLTKLVAKTRVTNSGYGFIINRDGKYVVHPDMGQEGLTEAETDGLAEGYRRMMNGEEGFYEGSIDEAKVLMVFSPIPIANWSIGVIGYEEEILFPIQLLAVQLNDYAAESQEKIVNMSSRSRFANGVISITVIVMVLLLSVFLTRVISAPIKKLAGEVTRIGEGDFTYRIPVESDDEIGFLAQVFNEMADNLSIHAQSIVLLNREKTKLTSAANTDALTGIYNRRCFMENAAKMAKSAVRSGMEAYIVFFDLDHFKQVNDTYGHLAGDNVLIYVADIVRHLIRENDFFTRYGGDEFILLLMNISKTSAWEIVERIRKNIHQSPVNFEDKQISISVSCGIVSVLPGADLPDLIALADHVLYKAKESGRNQTVFYSSEEEVARKAES